MFEKNVKTNMELEITEQTKIIPYILMFFIITESGEIMIDLPYNFTKIIQLISSAKSFLFLLPYLSKE